MRAHLGLLGLLVACTSFDNPGVELLDVDGVTVFAYEREPVHGDHALTTGEAHVADGCLLVGDSVVVWRPAQLGFVRDVVARVAAGEAPVLRVGGGGGGVTTDELAAGDACPGHPLWYASDPAEEAADTGA